MILLDTVVEVGTLPYPDRLQLASRLILEPVCGVTGQDGLAIGLTTIDYDPLGSAVSPESLSQKPFGGGQVTFFAEPELDRIAVAVNGAVQISPLTTYLDIRLIHMPFPPDGPFALIETLEKLGGVTDHPAADSGVVNGDAALCHHFLQIPQAQAISKIPPYAQQDHRSIKLPALEHLCHSLSPAQAIARDRKERVATDPKIHPKAIIDDLKRRTKEARAAEADMPDLFADFNGLTDPEDRYEFYRHSMHWQNRMILGDSLQVMASLAQREGLKGKVQCIHFDPPYGIGRRQEVH